MATTVAWVEPETAPNSVQATAVVMGSPPRIWPTKLPTRSSSRSAVRPLMMVSAARMNMGTATSTLCSTPPIICCTPKGASALYPDFIVGMETFSRVIWGVAPLLTSGNEPEMWQQHLQGIIHGTNPEHEEYWG